MEIRRRTPAEQAAYWREMTALIRKEITKLENEVMSKEAVLAYCEQRIVELENG